MPKNEGSDQDKKRDLIQSLESLRRPNNTTQMTAPAISKPSFSSSLEKMNVDELRNEVQFLTKELQQSRNASKSHKSAIQKMEQKTLDAIAEAGNLKRLLEQATANKTGEEADYCLIERDGLLKELKQSRDDHLMLTQALIDSENEISRLTKVLEKISLKLIAA